MDLWKRKNEPKRLPVRIVAGFLCTEAESPNGAAVSAARLQKEEASDI